MGLTQLLWVLAMGFASAFVVSIIVATFLAWLHR
jgi:hypothetical protein